VKEVAKEAYEGYIKVQKKLKKKKVDSTTLSFPSPMASTISPQMKESKTSFKYINNIPTT
jgi:hypothetical protein